MIKKFFVFFALFMLGTAILGTQVEAAPARQDYIDYHNLYVAEKPGHFETLTWVDYMETYAEIPGETGQDKDLDLWDAALALLRFSNQSTLEGLLDDFDDLEELDYTPASWTVLEDAVNAVNIVMPGTTRNELADWITDINAGFTGLVYQSRVDLQALVVEVDLLDEQDYLGATWDNLELAKTAAEAILANPNATNQELLDALADLQAAKDALFTLFLEFVGVNYNVLVNILGFEIEYVQAANGDFGQIFISGTITQAQLRDAVSNDGLVVSNLWGNDYVVFSTEILVPDGATHLEVPGSYTRTAWQDPVWTTDNLLFALNNGVYSVIPEYGYQIFWTDADEVSVRDMVINVFTNGIVILDTDDLVDLVADVNALTPADYVWGDIETALLAAEALLADLDGVTQVDIDDAYADLFAAYNARVFANQAALDAAIARYEDDYEGDENEYTVASWAALTTALGLPETTNAEVGTKAAQIQTALDALELRGQADLDAAINRAANLDSSLYTEASLTAAWPQLYDAFQMPQSTNQEMIDKADEINRVLDTLVLKTQQFLDDFIAGLTLEIDEDFADYLMVIFATMNIVDIAGTGSMVELMNEIDQLGVEVVSIAGYELTGNLAVDMPEIKAALIALMTADGRTIVSDLHGVTINVEVHFEYQQAVGSATFEITYDTSLVDQAYLDDVVAGLESDFASAITVILGRYSVGAMETPEQALISPDVEDFAQMILDELLYLDDYANAVSINGQAVTLAGVLAMFEAWLDPSFNYMHELHGEDFTIIVEMAYGQAANDTFDVKFIIDASRIHEAYLAEVIDDLDKYAKEDFASYPGITADMLIADISGTGTMVDLIAAIALLDVEVIEIAGYVLTGDPAVDMPGIKAAILTLMLAEGTYVTDLHGASIFVPVKFGFGVAEETATFEIEYDTSDLDEAYLNSILDTIDTEYTIVITPNGITSDMILDDVFASQEFYDFAVDIFNYIDGLPIDALGILNDNQIAGIIHQGWVDILGPVDLQQRQVYELHDGTFTFSLTFSYGGSEAEETVHFEVTYDTSAIDQVYLNDYMANIDPNDIDMIEDFYSTTLTSLTEILDALNSPYADVYFENLVNYFYAQDVTVYSIEGYVLTGVLVDDVEALRALFVAKLQAADTYLTELHGVEIEFDIVFTHGGAQPATETFTIEYDLSVLDQRLLDAFIADLTPTSPIMVVLADHFLTYELFLDDELDLVIEELAKWIHAELNANLGILPQFMQLIFSDDYTDVEEVKAAIEGLFDVYTEVEDLDGETIGVVLEFSFGQATDDSITVNFEFDTTGLLKLDDLENDLAQAKMDAASIDNSLYNFSSLIRSWGELGPAFAMPEDTPQEIVEKTEAIRFIVDEILILIVDHQALVNLRADVLVILDANDDLEDNPFYIALDDKYKEAGQLLIDLLMSSMDMNLDPVTATQIIEMYNELLAAKEDFDRVLALVEQNESAKDYDYTPAYTYGDIQAVRTVVTANYTLQEVSDNQATHDLARLLGALYRQTGSTVDTIVYKGVEYTWNLAEPLVGSNWEDAQGTTLVSVIVNDFVGMNLDDVKFELTLKDGDVELDVVVVVDVDYETQLAAIINGMVDTLDENDYTAASWANLQTALDMPDGTLEEIELKLTAVAQAIGDLNLKITDVTYNINVSDLNDIPQGTVIEIEIITNGQSEAYRVTYRQSFPSGSWSTLVPSQSSNIIVIDTTNIPVGAYRLALIVFDEDGVLPINLRPYIDIVITDPN